MHVEMRPIHTIRPYENNPRHNDAGVDAVIASIREFGWRQPIVVDEDGVIIVGHTRYKAALKLGLEEVPVHVAIGLTPAQAKAYRLADNQTATLSLWDDDKLPLELAQLQEMDFNLNLTGFSADELMRLLDSGSNAGQGDPDAVPEPPDEAITQPGDLWLLGKHRLLCGDSSKSEDVDRLLDGAAIHLVNTDPPYGVKVEPRSNNAIAAGLSSFLGATHHQSLDMARHPEKSQPTTRKLRAKDRPLANDFLSEEEFNRLLNAWFANLARVLLPGRAFYLWGGYANVANYPPVLKATGLYFSQAIIWDKQHPVLTRKDYMGAHEWCFYGWRGGQRVGANAVGVAEAIGPASGASGSCPFHSGDRHQAAGGCGPTRAHVYPGAAARRGRCLPAVGSSRPGPPSTGGRRHSLPPRVGWRRRHQRNSRGYELPRKSSHRDATMTIRTMAKKLTRLEALARRRNDRNTAVLGALASDLVRFLTDAGMEPDAWQAGVLRSHASRLLLLASRQAGKSSVAAALALQTALLRPRSPVLLLSPSLRQSGELYRKVVDLFGALGRPMGVTAESALRLELANGSRVVSLPGDEKNIRGFSGVALLVIDEAARVADSLYYAVRPMLAVSRGRLVALSTPFGKRGWYHDEWHGEGEWERVKITAEQCSRIAPEFLAEERRALGER